MTRQFIVTVKETENAKDFSKFLAVELVSQALEQNINRHYIEIVSIKEI